MQSIVSTGSRTLSGEDCRDQRSRVLLGGINVVLTRSVEFSPVESKKNLPEETRPRIALSYRIRKHAFNENIHDRVAECERQFPFVIPVSKHKCERIKFFWLNFT